MNCNDIQIKASQAEDLDTILNIEKSAFENDKEAQLTKELLSDPSAEPIVSLLAYYQGEAIGHILFTRVYFAEQTEQPMMHILAPLAVKPSFQRLGIGGMLIRAGLERLKEKGSNLVFVLGHQEYYPKFGFLPGAARLGYLTPYPIPEEYADYWMVQPISPLGFNVGQGKIQGSNVLNRPENWGE